MAYTYSKTDWTISDYLTHTELNRITENINSVFGTSLKTDYTQNDIITYEQWKAINAPFPTLTPYANLGYDSLNKLETEIEIAFLGLYPANNLYPSNTLTPR